MSRVDSRPQTTIGRLLMPRVSAAAGKSGVRLLHDALDAFVLRVLSARAAEVSIDAQYYIWRNDTTGRYIANELLSAADRGVRVRLLLDDLDARPRDDVLLALDSHENIEIRLFNPLLTRRGYLLTARELLHRASRLNHRMHNKAWIVDNQLAIVGGRNIADEYFAANTLFNFFDVDVALVGPSAAATQSSFEEYWSSRSAKRIGKMRRIGRKRLSLADVRSTIEQSAKTLGESDYARLVESSGELEALMHGDYQFEWSDVEFVADDPRKALRAKNLRPGVYESITGVVGAGVGDVLLVSSYFVPGKGGSRQLCGLCRRGVDVSVLTNSLAATDVAAVHSGYARYRDTLLQCGVRLYELKPEVSSTSRAHRLRIGSSKASLHSKAAIVDGERVFIGSYNLDPRSAVLNCENGVWIRSSRLAGELRAIFDIALAPQNSFEVMLAPSGRLQWAEMANGQAVSHNREPQASRTRRVVTRILGWLPIESQL